MKPTELLIIGYNGDEILFATNVTSECADVVLTRTDADGQVAVESTAQRAAPVFTSVMQLLSELTADSAK